MTESCLTRSLKCDMKRSYRGAAGSAGGPVVRRRPSLEAWQPSTAGERLERLRAAK